MSTYTVQITRATGNDRWFWRYWVRVFRGDTTDMLHYVSSTSGGWSLRKANKRADQLIVADVARKQGGEAESVAAVYTVQP